MDKTNVTPTRRKFLRNGGRLAASSASRMALRTFTLREGLIQLALVGAGGGTAQRPTRSGPKTGPIRLVAMADAFSDRLQSSYSNLQKSFPKQVDAPPTPIRGLDAYRKAWTAPARDVAIFATPPAFRWVTWRTPSRRTCTCSWRSGDVDGPTASACSSRQAGGLEEAQGRVGLMSATAGARELARRVRDGELGEIILPAATACTADRLLRFHSQAGQPERAGVPDRRFHSFLWPAAELQRLLHPHHRPHLLDQERVAGQGAALAEALPLQSEGVEYVDQNFDTYAVEYTFPTDQVPLRRRCMNGCQDFYSSYLHGTKAWPSRPRAETAASSRIYKSQRAERSDLVWESKVPQGEQNPIKTSGTT